MLAGMPPLPSQASLSADCFLLFLSSLALPPNEQVTFQKSVEQGTHCGLQHHSRGSSAHTCQRWRRLSAESESRITKEQKHHSVGKTLEPHGCRVLLLPPSRRIPTHAGQVLLEHHASCRSPGRHLHPHPHLRVRQPIN